MEVDRKKKIDDNRMLKEMIEKEQHPFVPQLINN